MLDPDPAVSGAASNNRVLGRDTGTLADNQSGAAVEMTATPQASSCGLRGRS
jgi:hypothetical protein